MMHKIALEAMDRKLRVSDGMSYRTYYQAFSDKSFQLYEKKQNLMRFEYA